MKIIITAEIVGKALLYEPAYRALAEMREETYEFAVTRDSSKQVFDSVPSRYGPLGECPPCRDRLYLGRVRNAEAGFSIQLYEWEEEPHKELLQGWGYARRKHILIHKGPAASEGCLLVAGGKRGFRRFKRFITRFVSNDIWVDVQYREIPTK